MGLMLGIFPLFYIAIIPGMIVLKIKQLFQKLFPSDEGEFEEYIPEASE